MEALCIPSALTVRSDVAAVANQNTRILSGVRTPMDRGQTLVCIFCFTAPKPQVPRSIWRADRGGGSPDLPPRAARHSPAALEEAPRCAGLTW